jgi:hypothetical protein
MAALAAIQVCLFLFGTAWLDRTFEGYHVPPMVAEVHKPDADALNLDDGQDDTAPIVLRSNTIIRPLTGGMSTHYEQPPSFVQGTTQYDRFGTTWLRSPPPPRLAV